MLTATTPKDAWTGIIAVVDATGYAVPKVIREYEITSLVGGLAHRIDAVIAAEVPPSGLTFYHLGLYDAYDPSTGAETVGMYFAGGIGDPAQSLSHGELTYRPEGGVLESTFLNSIKAAAFDLGAVCDVFEYGLLFGAAAVLARFALESSESVRAVTVGFDGGDYTIVRRDREAPI